MTLILNEELSVEVNYIVDSRELRLFGVVSLLDMLKFAAEDFWKASLILAEWRGNPGFALSSWKEKRAVSSLRDLIDHLRKLDLPVAVKNFERLVRETRDEMEAVEHLPEGQEREGAAGELNGRISAGVDWFAKSIESELESRVFLALESKAMALYNQSELFGADVIKRLPSIQFDMEEAGNCCALGRGTACVMHLNRVMECGLSALAKALGVSKQNDWGKYLSEIDSALQARYKSSGARSPDEQFYAEAHVTFDAVRRAWRNPTMHPEKTYTVERAEEILTSVGSFMRHLATRLRD